MLSATIEQYREIRTSVIQGLRSRAKTYWDAWHEDSGTDSWGAIIFKVDEADGTTLGEQLNLTHLQSKGGRRGG